jgi:hypothetical protein
VTKENNMNISLATAKKERPATNGNFNNDNDWLGQLPMGCTFYCKTGEGIYLTEYLKNWQQGKVVGLIQDKRITYVDSAKFSETYKLVHVYEEDTT